MPEERVMQDSGLVIVEIIELPGYNRGVRTTMSARDADAHAKAKRVKVIGAEKRPMNKLAPAENVKADVSASKPEGDEAEQQDNGGKSAKKAPVAKK